MKKVTLFLSFSLLLLSVTLTNCNKDTDNTDTSYAGGIAGLYHNNTYGYEITVTKVDNNIVSISCDNIVNFNSVAMNSATTFNLNKVNLEDSDNNFEYTGNGSCSNNNISVNVSTVIVEKASGDTTRFAEVYTGTKM
ncbi:MAG TPA: hypothetical protein VK174_09975 [Chitinophagales bacterium]|nr:hypothetical protein [Chitinophagales bacterium]